MKFVEEFLWRASFEGGAALLVVFLICRVASRIPANVKCWLWRLAWLRVLLCVFEWRLIEAPLLRAQEFPVAVVERIEKSSTPSGVQMKLATEPGVALAGSLEPRLPSWKPSGLQVVSAIWILGVAVAVGRIGFQFFSARRLQKSGCPHDCTELETICYELGVTKPALLISETATRPLLVGIFRPAIILPRGTQNGLDLILRHELAHLKRRDLLWNWLTAEGSALLWFHPLAWLAVKETNLAQEMACDELALGRDRSKARELANLLIDLAGGKDSGSPASISAVGIIQTKKNIERRIKAMNVQRRSGWWVAAALILVAPAIVPWRVVAQKAEARNQEAKPPLREDRSAPKPLSPEEKVELERKIREMEEETKILEKLGDKRVELFTKHHEKNRLQQKLAFANKDLEGVKKALKSQIWALEGLRNQAANHVALGIETPEKMEKFEADAKELRKQLRMYGPDLPGTPGTSAAIKIPIIREGVVVSTSKKRGERVRQNDEIVRLDDEEARIKLATARSELEIAEADFKLQALDIQNQLSQLKEKRALSIEEQSYKEKSELQLRKARAQLAISEQKLRQAELELRSYTILAPKDGVVAFAPRVGSRVGPTAGSLEYIPDED